MENLEDLKKVEEGRGILYGQIVEDRAWPVEKEKHFWDMSERLKIKLEKIDRKLLMNFNHQFNIEGFNGEYETHYMQIGFEMLQKLGYNFYENLVDQMVIEKITMLEKLRDECEQIEFS